MGVFSISHLFICNPFEFCDIVTTTTHKTLRSARGGMILTNSEEVFKKINSAVFPGLQGGPLMHIIAGKAAGFNEALTDEFKVYIKNVVENAKCLSKTLIDRGIEIVSGGTDTHIILIDLRKNTACSSLKKLGSDKTTPLKTLSSIILYKVAIFKLTLFFL